MYADENVIKIKHDVLYEVAKLAFADELEEKRDGIAQSLIPGPTPQFRCCIYKEREIIRQRVRLAEGKAPGMHDDGNIVQVISLPDLQLCCNRQLPELYRKGMYQRM
jgi:hypothetical protein